MNISARLAASPFSPARLSLTIATSHSNRQAYTNFATLSRTTTACAPLRDVMIFSDLVVICFLTVHFLKSARGTPRKRVESCKAGSVSSMFESFRDVEIWMFPKWSNAASSLKTAHCFSIPIPIVESAVCVVRNSSASSTPLIGVDAGPPCFR